jgi:hypothetical protein
MKVSIKIRVSCLMRSITKDSDLLICQSYFGSRSTEAVKPKYGRMFLAMGLTIFLGIFENHNRLSSFSIADPKIPKNTLLALAAAFNFTPKKQDIQVNGFREEN